MAKKVYIGVGQPVTAYGCPDCGYQGDPTYISGHLVECPECGFQCNEDEWVTTLLKGVARTVKSIYVGAAVDTPQYEEIEKNVTITADNITDYFTVTNGDYYFQGNGGVFASNNYGISNSTASTVLTAKKPIRNLSFSYSWSSESNYDKFTLKVAGVTVEDAVSGNVNPKQYTTDLADGQSIEFIYSKDGSTNSYNDVCTFSNMAGTFVLKEQTGVITTQNVARKVKKGYVGVNGVARMCFGNAYEEALDALFYGMKSVDSDGANQSSTTSTSCIPAVTGWYYLVSNVTDNAFKLMYLTSLSDKIVVFSSNDNYDSAIFISAGEAFVSSSGNSKGSYRGSTIARVSFPSDPSELFNVLTKVKSFSENTSAGDQITIGTSDLTGVNYIFGFLNNMLCIGKYKDGEFNILYQSSTLEYLVQIGDEIGWCMNGIPSVFQGAARGSIYVLKPI